MRWNGSENLRTLVILGAGATRGASFVDESSDRAKPPLDTDFFSQLEIAARDEGHCRCANTRFGEERVGAELPQPGKSRMEDYFVQTEFVERLRTGAPVQQSHCEKFRGVLSSYTAAIAALIHDTTSQRHCEHHAALARNLQSGDAVVTFNYDLLMDRAMQSLPAWDDNRAYAFTPKRYAPISRDLPTNNDYTSFLTPDSPVRLLKLHGSLAWERVDYSDTDRESRYEFNRLHCATPASAVECNRRCSREAGAADGRCHFSRCLIVPPVWDKPVTESKLFKHLWAIARVALRKCEALVVVGYSLPVTDKLAQAWFAVDTNLATSRPSMKHLIVVDPSKDVFARYVAILAATKKEPRAVHYCPSWTDFCNQLG